MDNSLLEVFTGYENYPILENVKGGKTDYIDNIEPEQMKSSLMKGIDNYQRSFIVAKIFPRELYNQMLQSQIKNYKKCLTLVALSRNHYLPLDISRYIQEFLEFRPIFYYTHHTKKKKVLLIPNCIYTIK